jgi:hypothetical protein
MLTLPRCAKVKLHFRKGSIIQSKPVLICGKRENIPKNAPYVYGLRHSDNDWGLPRTIEPEVYVNRWGYLISQFPIKMPKKGYFVIRQEDRWAWNNAINNL